MLYERCKEKAMSLTIIRLRWQLFGHILRLQNENTAAPCLSIQRASEEHQEN